MKSLILILLIACTTGNVILGQTKMSKQQMLEKKILDLDIAAWDAWKNKDVEYFRANTIDEFLNVTPDGVTTRAEMIEAAFKDCNVKSFSLHNVEYIILNKKAVLMTYTATLDAECDSAKLHPNVRASVTYVKRGGKWLEAFYIDMPIEK